MYKNYDLHSTKVRLKQNDIVYRIIIGEFTFH